jgi:hypothetical protein
MGEKGNLAVDDPLLALDALPLDAIKSSPETVGSWLDTYLKFREAREASSGPAEGAEETAVKIAEETVAKVDGAGPTAGD